MTKYIILLCLFALFNSCLSRRTENYYLPENFEGNVAIIYNNIGRPQDKIQNWTIPANGILKTEFRFTEGNTTTNFYQRKSPNLFDTLNYVFQTKDPTKNEIVFQRLLTFSRAGSKNIFFVNTFYIGKKSANQLEKDRFFFDRQLEKILLEN